MIHLVIREPNVYQRTLCQTLSDSYDGAIVAWFADQVGCEEFKPSENFTRHVLAECGHREMFRALRSDREAVIVLGGWSSAMAYKTLLIATLLRIPFLIWADHPHPRQRNRIVDRLRNLYVRILGRRASAFLACGNPTVEHLATLGIPRKKLFNFPYWVDLPEKWSPPERCLDDTLASQPLRLIAIGRLVPMKAFDIAIRAVALANKTAERAVTGLVVIGDGPERKRLAALAKSLGCEHVVCFSGWLPNDDVRAVLHESDAVIVPSEFEPYGVVVLEALAAGRPVLASERVVAALDRDEQSGAIFFHASGDAETLAAQILKLARNSEVLLAASLAARVTAEKWPPQLAATSLRNTLNLRKVTFESAPIGKMQIAHSESKSANA